METIDHPVWVLKWSLSWGLYSHLGPSKTWTMMTVGSWIPTRWAPGDFAWPCGDTVGGTWPKGGFSMDFLMILRDFHPMFFCWFFSTCFPHQSSTQHRSNFNKLVAFNTCDAGHEFTDTFRLHYVRRVGGVNSSLMEFLKSGLLDGCYDILASLARSAVEECHWRRNSVRRRGRKRSHNETVVYGGII